jgi:hypothetical protein
LALSDPIQCLFCHRPIDTDSPRPQSSHGRTRCCAPLPWLRRAHIHIHLRSALAHRKPFKCARCGRVPCGVDHAFGIAVLLSRPRPSHPFFILPPRRSRMRSKSRECPPPRLGRDAKGNVRLYARRGHRHPSLEIPTLGVDMHTDGMIRFVFIYKRQTFSFARRFPRSSTGALSFMRANIDLSQ